MRDELRVLDRAPCPGHRERVEGVGVRDVADRVDRRREPAAGPPGHEIDERRRVDGQQPVVVRVAGIRVRARRRAGAERSVGDDLERTDAHELRVRRRARGRRTAGPPRSHGRGGAGRSRTRRAGVEPRREAARPGILVPRHVEIDESDDAACGGRPRHSAPRADPRSTASTALSRREISNAGSSRRMPIPSGSNPSRRSAAVFSHTLCTSALMRYVGHLAGRRIEHLEGRRVRPEAVAESRCRCAVRRPSPVRAPMIARRVRGGRRRAERLALGRQRPLHDVDVVIPESRDQPRPAAVEHPAAPAQCPRRGDVDDHAVGEMHVDRVVGERIHPLAAGEPHVRDDVDAFAAAEAHRAAFRASRSRCISPAGAGRRTGSLPRRARR